MPPNGSGSTPASMSRTIDSLKTLRIFVTRSSADLIRSCDQTSRNGEESKSSRHRPTRVSAGGAEIAATHPLQGRHTEHNGQRIACWQALIGSALCQAGQPEFLLV